MLVTSAQRGVFSSGANIFMLGASRHGFKVNFCKFTNETRLAMEEASRESGQVYVAAVNGVCSGGGYELALACEEILLVDDRRSAVALPEIPYLGVLPGTGGLTRLVDKRMIRPDRADVFATLAEGLKGKKALAWGLVDAIFPASRFEEAARARAAAIAGPGHPERRGITLPPLQVEVTEEGRRYGHVSLSLAPAARTARLRLELPAAPLDPGEVPGADWLPLRLFRELDDALLHLRFNHPGINLVLVETRGTLEAALAMDAALQAHKESWLGAEVLRFIGRTLKRLEYTAKSFFALIDSGSCFAGVLLELCLACDRSFMLDEPGVAVQLGSLHGGAFPRGNGLTRLQQRFLGRPAQVERLIEVATGPLEAEEAEEAGLVTFIFDDIDWEDELRLAVEERASLSPDALTGAEANLRFAGPETLETKIFGRLSAWQNWIFQRPNAVGPRGALTLYGRPETAEFDYERT